MENNKIQTPEIVTDSFGTTQEFINKQQEKFIQNAPSVEVTPGEKLTPEVQSPVIPSVNNEQIAGTQTPSQVTPPIEVAKPVVQAVPETVLPPKQEIVTQKAPELDNKPATPTTVMPPPAQTKTPTIEDKKAQETANQAIAINKIVDKNRANGMNEQQAFESAMKEYRGIKPTVRELRASVPDTGRLGTQDERRAQFENGKLSKYNTMTSEQLFSELKAGNLTPKLQQELAQNPSYAKAKEKYDKQKQIDNINNATASLLGVQTQKDPLAELSNTLVNIFSQQGGQSSVGQFREYLSQNPTITGKTAEYNTLAAERMEVQRARDNVVKDLKAKYSGLPLSTILGMAARETEPLNERLNTLNDSMVILGSEIKQETEFAQKEFDIYREEQAAAQAKQAQLQQLLANVAIGDYQTTRNQQFDIAKMQMGQEYQKEQMAIQNKYQTDRDVNNFVQDLQKIGIQNEFEFTRALQNQGFQKELLALNQKYENSRSVRDFQNDLKKMGYQFNMTQQAKALDLANEKEMLDYKASLDPELALKWQNVAEQANQNSSLLDLYGKNVATYPGNRGHDLAGKLGDAIVAPPGAKVIAINAVEQDGTVSVFEEGKGPMSKKDPGWGNSVLLQLPDGSKMRLSHLQDIAVGLSESLAGGQLIGTRGNTGNVKGANGEILTDAQKLAGRGAHVDVEIFDPSGKLLSESQQVEYLKSVKPFAKTETQQGYSDGDIATFNSEKYNPQTDKNQERVQRYYDFVNERANLQGNPNTSVLDLMKLSRGQKDLGQAENKAYKDINTVVGQLAGLDKAISSYNDGDNDLGPITGLIASKNPWDTKAQEVQARLQALLPKVARGVFGEVGVLTDQDIASYMKTLPNIKQTADVQDVVQYALLDTLRNSLESAIAIDSGTYDISGLAGQYKKLSEKISKLENKIIEPTQQDYTDAYLKTLGY